MKTTTKEQLIELLERQASEKQASTDRRRRLDGRLEAETLDALADLLPNVCKYQITTNGNIRADWFALNCNIKNLHIFNNNTQYIQIDTTTKYTYIVVIKATFQAIVKVKTRIVLYDRLTLEEIKFLIEEGQAETLESLKGIAL